MTNFSTLLRALDKAGVEYILVGGAAATVHGSARLTLDVDVVYRRARENLARVRTELCDVHDAVADDRRYERAATLGQTHRA